MEFLNAEGEENLHRMLRLAFQPEHPEIIVLLACLGLMKANEARNLLEGKIDKRRPIQIEKNPENA